MEDLRPVIATSINGADARFIVDTGSFFDFMSPAAAAEFKLPLGEAPYGYYVSGVGGSFIPRIATAKTFSVAGIEGHNAEFLVGNNDFGNGLAGILGQNIFRIADIDFDFANGELRFVKPQHCGDEILAYWATAQQPIAMLRVDWTTTQRSTHLVADGRGERPQHPCAFRHRRVALGPFTRRGETRRHHPRQPGRSPRGRDHGLGSKVVKVWVAPIDKFEIGGETIEHTHLLIGDIGLGRCRHAARL